MYSEAKVSARLSTALAEFAPDFAKLSARPDIKYHTVPEVEEFEDQLRRNNKYLYSDTGIPIGTQNLTSTDRLFILNERILVMCDAAYALTRFCWVKDEENIVRRFNFRVAQRVLFEIISDLEDMDVAIELMILKARQLGISTLIELLIMLRIVMNAGVNAVIASADRQKSGLMANMLFMAYDMLPVWMRPKWTSRVQSDQGKLVLGALNSGVSIQHGNQMSGIARGWTPTVYHLAEVASFDNPEEQIEASLLKCVHASISVFGVLETTGEGDEGWWPDTWRWSKANWKHHRARLCPQFLPWVCGTDLYPKPAWLRLRPVPDAWYERRLPDTKEHVAKVEAYIASQPLLKKHLSPDRSWRMPLAQQWFWEVGHEEAKAKGNESLWFQEMAGDDVEALQRSSESVFGFDTIESVSDNRKRSYSVYGISGQSIEDVHEPPTEDIDYGSPDHPRERTVIRWKSPLSSDTFRWELIPLHHDEAYVSELSHTNPGAFRDYAHGKLLVFHPPQPGVDYSIGVDTANGIGQDSTVICVTAVGTRGNPDMQAAEFRSAFVSHVEAYAFVAAVAAYYAQHMESSTPYRQPKLGIEQVAAVGDTCQVQLRKLGFHRFHQMIRYDSKDLRKSRSRKMGWYTFQWSRPLLTDGFVHSLQNGWYVLNSPWTIDECAHFEVHYTAAGKERKEHAAGEHDDGIFAAGISTFIAHDLETMTNRSKKRFVDSGGAGRPPLDLAPYSLRINPATKPLTSLDDLL